MPLPDDRPPLLRRAGFAAAVAACVAAFAAATAGIATSGANQDEAAALTREKAKQMQVDHGRGDCPYRNTEV